MSATCTCLILQHDQRDTPPQDKELSLVAFIPPGSGNEDNSAQVRQVRLLHWYAVGESGRCADLDERNAVKTIVPVGPKRWPLSFKDLSMSMVLPRTGTCMVREIRKARPALSHEALRVMRLWDMSFSFRYGLTAGHLSPPDSCDLCGKTDVANGECKVCPCCLVTGHASCFERVKTAYDQAKSTVPAVKSSSRSSKRQRVWPTPSALPCTFVWDNVFLSSKRCSGWGRTGCCWCCSHHF